MRLTAVTALALSWARGGVKTALTPCSALLVVSSTSGSTGVEKGSPTKVTNQL